MFSLKTFLSNSKSFPRINSSYLRHSSTEVSLKGKPEIISRRFVKRRPPLELEHSSENFLKDLFDGVISKKIFRYPAPLREEDIDLAVNHCLELEKFLNQTRISQINDDVLKSLKDLELFGITVPPEYGGAGYDMSDSRFLLECAGINPIVGRFIGYQECFGCKILSLYGNEEQKAKYLPSLALGNSFMGLAYLESDSLIDLSDFKGLALKNESDKKFILTAKKKWVHNADKADFFLVMANLTNFSLHESGSIKNFKVFIVDKKTPGVTVHKLILPKLQDVDIFEVTFDKVFLPIDSVLGDEETDGFAVLKSALTHCNTTDAVLILSLLKQMLHNAVQLINDRILYYPNLKSNKISYESLALFATYIYGLESAIYMFTGRYDKFINPNFFDESVMTKALAVDFLQLFIQKYMNLIGRECYEESGILHEALRAYHYYSFFEDNIDSLKLINGGEAMASAGRSMSEKVMKLRNPFENYIDALKEHFTPAELKNYQYRKKQNFFKELHYSFSQSGKLLNERMVELQICLENYFLRSGNAALDNEYFVLKFGEVAAYMYAAIASLSRGTSSIKNGLPNYKEEANIALTFSWHINYQMKQILDDISAHSDAIDLRRKIGKLVFQNKEYPVEHPVSREF